MCECGLASICKIAALVYVTQCTNVYPDVLMIVKYMCTPLLYTISLLTPVYVYVYDIIII